MRYNYLLILEEHSFIIRTPITNNNTRIHWDQVDTIIFQPFVAPSDGTYFKQRYVLFLNSIPEVFLDAESIWINRVMYKIGFKGLHTRINITDQNRDFNLFRPAAAKGIGFVATPQEGFLDGWNIISQETTLNKDGSFTNETHARPPEDGADYGYRVIYDRWGRRFQDIYDQHGSI